MADSTPSTVALATLHDAARCLALAERRELTARPEGGLDRASWRLLHSYAAADRRGRPPLAESDVPVLSWIFRSLGLGGLLGAVNGQIRASGTAHDWLALTAADQLSALRQLWRRAPEVAWTWLPQGQRYPARAHIWRTVTEQLLTVVAALPVEHWAPGTELAADLIAQSQDLGCGVERNLPAVRQALRQQARQLTVFLLTELLPRLDLLAAAGTGDDQCLALTAAGADWLRAALQPGKTPPDPARESERQPADPEPAAQAPACWQVTDDLRVIVPLTAPAAATFEILQFADLLSVGPPAAYRITGASLERGLSHGYDLADVHFLLAQGAGQPLSGAALLQLARWQEALVRIRCEPGFCLRPDAPATLSSLRRRQPFRAATELGASRRWAFVGQAEAAPLMRYLRRAGYVLTADAAGPDRATPPAALSPLLRRRLPLTALATLAGVYGRLRAYVPGLADLGLADLEQALLAALPPHSQAAVARLVTSNDALIAQRLSTTDNDPEALPAPAAGPPAPVAARRPDPAGIMDPIHAALAAGTALDIFYADTGGEVTQRRIRPLRLEERWGRQYVVAYCELRRDERSFRLDRIVEIL